MRRYKRKPYKIKPYKSYRNKPKKLRRFLISILVILLGVIIFSYILPSIEIVPPKSVSSLKGYTVSPEIDYELYYEPLKIKGIYVSGNRAGSEQMDDLIDLCNRSEINAMVTDVKSDHGNLTFNVDNNIIKQAGIVTKSVLI